MIALSDQKSRAAEDLRRLEQEASQDGPGALTDARSILDHLDSVQGNELVTLRRSRLGDSMPKSLIHGHGVVLSGFTISP